MGDGDEVALDKKRLNAALEAEKKRKAMGEDEAWASSKKGKTEVTQEELGKWVRGCADGLRGVQVGKVDVRRSDGKLQGYRGVGGEGAEKIGCTVHYASCLGHVIVLFTRCQYSYGKVTMAVCAIHDSMAVETPRPRNLSI
jgi:hypothetical protein